MADHVTALNADVVWHVETGKAEVDIERLRRSFYESTNQMSTQTLKLQSAQEKLDRALVKHGTTSRQAREAEIQLRRAMTETTTTAQHQSNVFGQTERSVERLGRGAVVGSGAVRGLARAAVFASTSFLGGFGLVYALRTAVTAGEALEISQRQLDTQFRANHESIRRGRTLLAQLEQQMIDVGHTSTETAAAFSVLDRATGDAAKAADLMGLAADLAAARHLTLEKAAVIVSKVVNGNTGLLKRYGIAVKDGASVTAALAAAQEKLAGQAKAATTPQEQLHAALVNTEAAIGKQLLPTVHRLETELVHWLGNTRNQQRIQRDVNEAVRVGTQVAHGFAGGLREIRAVAGPVVDALGGVENTAKLMVEAFAVYKLAKVVQGIRGIGLAARFSRREIVALNETPVAPKGAPVGGRGIPVGFPIGVAAFDVAAILATKGDQGGGGPGDPHLGQSVGKRYPILDRIGHDFNFPNSIDPDKRASAIYIYTLYRRGLLTSAQAERALQNLDPYGTFGSRRAGQSTSDRQPGRSPGGAGAPGADGSGTSADRPGRKHGFSLTYALQLQEAKAAAGQGSVIGAAQDELRYVKAQLAAGHLNKQGVLDALAEQSRLEDQIDGILQGRKNQADAAERKRAAAHRKELAEEKRRKHEAERRAKERERARRERIRTDLGIEERKLTNQLLKAQLTTTLTDDRAAYEAEIAFYRKEEHDRRLTRQEREGYVTKELRARKDEAALGKRLKGASNIDFFSEAAANFRTYGGNVGGVLSGQDARGLLARIALTLEENTRHAKSTAATNKQIVKSGPHPAKTAAALADVGAWTH